MIKIELQNQLLQCKAILNQISDISYSFSKINRNFDEAFTDEEKAKALISSYVSLILQTQTIIENFSKLGGEK